MASKVNFAAAVSTSFRRELAHVRRSVFDRLLLFVLPPIAIVLVAAIFSSGVIRDIPVALVDMDGSSLSRAIERNLLANPKIHVVAMPKDLAAAWPMVRSGRVYNVVYLPPGLEARARRHEEGGALIYFNAASQTVGAQAANAATASVQAAGTENVSPSHEGESALPLRLHLPKI